MTAVALSTNSEVSSTVFHKKPDASKGPVILVIDSKGATLNTGKQQLFAASASLSQAGEVLATFSAHDASALSELMQSEVYNDFDLEDVAGLESEDEVFFAYKNFINTCYKQVRYEFTEILNDDADDAVDLGLFQVIEVGYSETHKHSHIMALRAHPLASIMVGMGYKPSAIESLLDGTTPETKYRYNGVAKNAAKVTDIYWKARNRDAGLDSCKLF